MLVNYYAVAEPNTEGGWRISFLDGVGIAAVAACADQIVARARDALMSKVTCGRGLPRSIEQGERAPNLAKYHPAAMIVVIPFDPAAAVRLAA